MQDIIWRPNPGPQTRFLASTAAETLYGGAAGGGKSAASIALPLRWTAHPRFRCLFLRREAKYLADALDKSGALYPAFGARLVRSPKMIWTFPSGATVWLNHCEHESDVANYDSLEFHLVIFEELTHFTEKQYVGIKARIRGPEHDLPRAARATCNPGGIGAEWVFKRWGAWLDPEHDVHAGPGELLHYRGDERVPAGTPDSLSRTFIPAKLADNPHIGPEYRAQLMQLDPVRRAQLESGDWLVQPGAGLYFKRAWFGVPVATLPAAPVVRVRYWDRASTEGGGDWTVGLRLSKTADGVCWVEDVVRVQQSPGGVEATIRATAALDPPGTVIGLEQDPGSAGKFEAAYYVRALPQYATRVIAKRVDKVTAAGPVSSQALAGNVRLARGRWTEALVQELEAFPEGAHDDQVDALSGAYAMVATAALPGRPIVVGSPRSAGW